MLHPHLRSNTDIQHQQLEKQFTTLLQEVKNPGDYAEFLKLIASFLIPLENRIHQFPLETLLPDKENRRRSKDLLSDIRQYDPAWKMEQNATLPSISSLYHAIGALYVLEGSTLGGPFIARMLRNQTGFNPSLQYFENYKENRKPMWDIFRRVLDEPALQPHTEIITSSAIGCFTAYLNWLELNSKFSYATNSNESMRP
jgi:heme oxygenase